MYCVYVYICTFVYIYLYIYTCTCTFTWKQIYLEIWPHTAMYFSNFILYLFTSIFSNTYKSRNTYTYKYVYVCMYTYTILFYVYINIYTNTSIRLQMCRKIPVWYSQISLQRLSTGFVERLSGSVFCFSVLIGFSRYFIILTKKRLKSENCLEEP